MRDTASPIPSGAVMVMSCDAYRDLWTPFFTLFWRFWPDCPFPVYLGSNRASFNHSRVRTLAGGDSSWSKVLRLSLERIDAAYILLLLDDFFLDRPVDHETIGRHLQTLDALHGTVLRLFPHPPPQTTLLPAHPDLGRLSPAAEYRVSAQAAWWNRTELLALLRDEESIWDFEWNGTARVRNIPDGFYSTYKKALSYRQVIERGQWFWGAARYYARQQIGCDFTARSVMGPGKALKKAINRFRKNSISSVMCIRVAGVI